MVFENIIDNSFDPNIFYYIIASIIILIFNKYFLAEWLKKKQSEKRIGMWIDFLRSDKSIDLCLTEFEEIGSQSKHIFLSIIVGLVVAILVVFIFLLIIVLKEWDLEYLTFINFIPYLLIMLIAFYVGNKMKKNEKIISSSDLIYSIIRFYYSFIIFSNVFILMYFYNILLPLNNLILLIMSYFTLLLSIITSIIIQKSFSEQVKYVINNKYVNSFPYLEITTDKKEIIGNIRNIFNKNLIVIEDGEGLISVVEWDSISSLRLQKTKIIQSHIDKY